MRRAVIFVTLLLLAVAGATIAQEGTFRNDKPAENISPGATASESTLPETTTPGSPEPEPEIPQANDQEATSPEKPEPEPSEEGETSEVETQETDGPDGARDAPEDENKVNRSDEGEDEAVDGLHKKVTLCHKGRITISVGAPAQAAHARHGDALGACGAGGTETEDSSGPEKADGPNGRGWGPPDNRGRPEGAGTPGDAGKKLGAAPPGLEDAGAEPDAGGTSVNGSPGGKDKD